MCRELTRKFLPPYYYQDNFTQKQLSKKSSYQPISSTKNQINSHKPLIHQPIFHLHPNITQSKREIPRYLNVSCVKGMDTYP